MIGWLSTRGVLPVFNALVVGFKEQNLKKCNGELECQAQANKQNREGEKRGRGVTNPYTRLSSYLLCLKK